ncbi:hypothetical protein RHMOL_Rhmol13G0118600 [Rhododendron molle]|uniref:Uncharacterized protein n=1 Tax=Rhododendron molle TaxID=49168 RepID=A0ACC0L5Y2_RHOML|nr:hypothetical protein RHMOL_Rhmol13G0118600 [Rhododendron molle]
MEYSQGIGNHPGKEVGECNNRIGLPHSSPNHHPQSVMINEAHYLMAQTNTSIGHTYSLANQCADHLARMGAEHTYELVFVMDMPIAM